MGNSKNPIRKRKGKSCGIQFVNTYFCKNCAFTESMKHVKDKLMRSHAREVRKRLYRCPMCKEELVEHSRRFPGEEFEVSRLKFIAPL